MKIKITSEGSKTFLSAKLGRKDKFNPREIEMLTMQVIPELAPPAAVKGRKNNVIMFDVSQYSTLEFYVSCVLTREQFADVLIKCIETFRKMQQVYLNYNNLVLALDKIYVKLDEHSLHFIYLPLQTKSQALSLPRFFVSLVQSAGRSTYEQVQFLEGCMAFLQTPGAFSLEAFTTYVRRNASVVVDTNSSSNQCVQPKCQIPRDNQFYFPDALGGTARIDALSFGQNQEGTVKLEDNIHKDRPKFILTRISNGEKVEIKGDNFVVGTDSANVDYLIVGNSAISRKHAVFGSHEGDCTIADQKSTNKTFINGYELEPFVTYLLNDGDVVQLGNEDFLYKKVDEEQ